jgi:Fibronectin type III domain
VVAWVAPSYAKNRTSLIKQGISPYLGYCLYCCEWVWYREEEPPVATGGMRLIPEDKQTFEALATHLVCWAQTSGMADYRVQVGTNAMKYFRVPADVCAQYGPPPFTSKGEVITCSTSGKWEAWDIRLTDVLPALDVNNGCTPLPLPALAAPGGVTATAVSDTEVTVTWNAVPGATGYVVQYRASGTTAWTDRAEVTATTDTVTGLTAGTTYQFRVIAKGDEVVSSDSPPSIIQVVTTPPPALAAPAGLTGGTPTVTTIPASWTAVPEAEGYVLRYRVTGTTNWTTRTQVTATNDTITGLLPNTSYDLQVQAKGDGTTTGDSPFSATVAVSTASGALAAPAGLSGGTPTATTIPATWTAVPDAVGYVVRYRVTSTTDWTTRTQVTATNDTITGLTAETSYDVQVQAKGNGTTNTDSPFSATVAVTTAAAAGLMSTTSSRSKKS